MNRLSKINLILVLLGYLGLINNNDFLMLGSLAFACITLIFCQKVSHFELLWITFGLILSFMMIIAKDMDYQGLDWFLCLMSLDLALYIEKIAYLKNVKAILSSYFMMVMFGLVLIIGLFLLSEAGVSALMIYRLALSCLLLLGPYLLGLSLVLMLREYLRRS